MPSPSTTSDTTEGRLARSLLDNAVSAVQTMNEAKETWLSLTQDPNASPEDKTKAESAYTRSRQSFHNAATASASLPVHEPTSRNQAYPIEELPDGSARTFRVLPDGTRIQVILSAELLRALRQETDP